MAPIVQTPPAIPCDQRAAQWGQLLNRFKSELTISSTVHEVSDYKERSYKERRWNFGKIRGTNAEQVKIKEHIIC